MSGEFKRIGEYDCLMAEVLRRNPEYAKEAKAIKDEWGRHAKSTEFGFHLSDEYATFCKKRNLKIHPDSFLDPDDLSNPVQRSPFKESPSGHIQMVTIEAYDEKENLVYRLKPKRDKIYLEIDRFIGKEVFEAKIKPFLKRLRTDNRRRLDKIRRNTKLWDLIVVEGKTIKEAACNLKEKPNTIAKAAIRAYELITGKPFTKNSYKQEGMAEPGVCAKCEKYDSCVSLCLKAEKFAGADDVGMKDYLPSKPIE